MSTASAASAAAAREGEEGKAEEEEKTLDRGGLGLALEVSESVMAGLGDDLEAWRWRCSNQ